VAASTSLERSALSPAGKRAERLFFGVYPAAILAAIFVGFGPSFYLRGIVEPYWPMRPLSALVVVHAIVMTGWVLLFPLQAALVASGRQALHQRVGTWGFVLAAVMVPLAYSVAAQLSHEARTAFKTVFDLFLLAAMLAVAWRWRRNGQAHKRMMVAILCLLAMNAIERMPFWDDVIVLGAKVARLWALPLLMPLWVWDLASNRRLHRATLAGSAFLAVATIVRLRAPPDWLWSQFVVYLPGFAWQ
jgi:hypothetical protein